MRLGLFCRLMRLAMQIPMTLISGFRGSGKSSVIQQLKRDAGSTRLTVLIDDGAKDLSAEIEEAVEVAAAAHGNSAVSEQVHPSTNALGNCNVECAAT